MWYPTAPSTTLRRRSASLGDDFERTLRGARRGRQRAWDALYRDLAPPVLGYLRAQRAPEPEDVLGEVFVELVRSLDRFGGDEAGFRAWVFTIAHHRLIDARRTAMRRPVRPAPASELEPDLPVLDGDALALERLSTDAVMSLLGRLGDDQREVLVLRLVAGLRTAEVAEVTGRSPEAVKGLSKRGLARLRQLLGAEQRPDAGAQQADVGCEGGDRPPPPADAER
jgi:RNA polymerase sigma factor (sigma-70 family)